jgi:hypothetical protein
VESENKKYGRLYSMYHTLKEMDEVDLALRAENISRDTEFLGVI